MSILFGQNVSKLDIRFEMKARLLRYDQRDFLIVDALVMSCSVMDHQSMHRYLQVNH